MREDEVKIAFSRGNAEEPILKLLKAVGTEIEREEGLLTAKGKLSTGLPFRGYFMRPRDVPKAVEKGYAHVGFTGTDWCTEYGVSDSVITELLQPDGPVHVVVFTPKWRIWDPRTFTSKITVASEYPNRTAVWLAEQGIDATVEDWSGSIEGFACDWFFCGVTVEESGETLEKHNLARRAVICKSVRCMLTKERTMNDPQVGPHIKGLASNLQNQCVTGAL